MELRQLEAFVAVAEERNFTRAAARLYVAQSGLSATVRSLESELRAPLFVRSTRRVDLTPAGAALLPEAHRTLASARAAAEAVASVEGLQRGTLTLGVMQASWLFDLAGLLARYRATYPGIELRLRHASSAELVRLVRDGVVDITFATTEPGADLASVPLFQSLLVVAHGASEPIDGQETIALAQLADREQITFPVGWGIRTVTDAAWRSAAIEPRMELEVNDTNTLLDLVEAGLGIALIPEALARLRPQLLTKPIRDGTWYWTIGAQTIAPLPVNPAARALWSLLSPETRSA